MGEAGGAGDLFRRKKCEDRRNTLDDRVKVRLFLSLTVTALPPLFWSDDMRVEDEVESVEKKKKGD